MSINGRSTSLAIPGKANPFRNTGDSSQTLPLLPHPPSCCYEFWIEEESAGEMKKDEEVKEEVYVY